METRRSTKLALALTGGGFTGYLFEVGAMTALDDLLGESFTSNDFDLYVGVSAGSAVAALLAQGVKPEEIFETNLSGSVRITLSTGIFSDRPSEKASRRFGERPSN